jgi:hypothetical protein
MTGLCRYDAYVVVAAQLDGGEYAVDVCDEPATHRALVRRAGDGLAVEIDVEVCAEHQHEVGAVPGYQRSIKFRARSST